jgi:hypothetical protein
MGQVPVRPLDYDRRCAMHRLCTCMRRLLVTAKVVPSSSILVILIKEAPDSSETSVLTRATWPNILEDGILYVIAVNISVDDALNKIYL